MYLVPEKNPTDKETNAQTLRRADAIKSQKNAELYDTVHCFSVSKARVKVNVFDFIESIAEKGDRNKNTIKGYLILAKQLEKYVGNKLTFKIDKKICFWLY